MKIRKRFLVLIPMTILIIAIVLILISNEDKISEEKKVLKIGVALYSKEDAFLSNIMSTLKEKAMELEEKTGLQIYINIVDSNEDQYTQNSQIERFIALNYDVLCVNLVDRTNATQIIDIAKEADVPLVFFNREPVQEDMERWEKVYYVGTDARESAYLQAQIIISLFNKNPSRIDLNGDGIIQYVMLEGESRHQDALIRTEGSIRALKEAGLMVEKVDGAIANWDRNQARTLIDKIFKKSGKEVELIISNNDDMALGAVEALDSLKVDFSNIVGIDGTPQGLKAIEEGQLLGTVIVNYEAQGEAIFTLAYYLAMDMHPEKLLPIDDLKAVRVPMSTAQVK